MAPPASASASAAAAAAAPPLAAPVAAAEEDPLAPVAGDGDLELESVLGLSEPGPCTLAHCPDASRGHLAAYAAGAGVVLYSVAARRQLAYLRPPALCGGGSNGSSGGGGASGSGGGCARPIAAVAWAPDGRHLVAGEGGGASGSGSSSSNSSGGGATVYVWDLSTGACVQQLKGQHRAAGVGALSFSPDGRLLATAGGRGGGDAAVCVWDWRAGRLLARQALPAEAAGAAFAGDGAGLVAAGRGAFKVWAISDGPGAAVAGNNGATCATAGAGVATRTRAAAAASAVVGSSAAAAAAAAAAAGAPALTLTAKPVSLKDHRGAPFVALRAAPLAADAPPGATAGAGGMYALTATGTLLLLRGTARAAEKAVDLKVSAAFALAAAPGLVAAACAGGVVRLFASRTLEFKGTLPRLLPRGGAAAAGFAPGGWRASLPAGGGGDGSGGGGGGGGGTPTSTPGGGGAAVTAADAGGALCDAAFPDAVGCEFAAGGAQLAVAYRDRAVVWWDVANPAAVREGDCGLTCTPAVRSIFVLQLLPALPLRLALLSSNPARFSPRQPPLQNTQAVRLFALSAHSAPVYDLAVLPAAPRLLQPGADAAAAAAAAAPPPARAATCGADGTIRIWSLDPAAGGGGGARTLAGIITTSVFDGQTPEAAALAAAAAAAAPAPGAALALALSPAAGAPGPGAAPVALRCLRLSPDARHLAAGDDRGNIRVRGNGVGSPTVFMLAALTDCVHAFPHSLFFPAHECVLLAPLPSAIPIKPSCSGLRPRVAAPRALPRGARRRGARHRLLGPRHRHRQQRRQRGRRQHGRRQHRRRWRWRLPAGVGRARRAHPHL